MKNMIVPLLLLFMLSASFAQTAPPANPDDAPASAPLTLEDQTKSWVADAFSYVINNVAGKGIYNMLMDHTKFCRPPPGENINSTYISTLSLTGVAIMVSLLISIIIFMIAKMLAKHDSPVSPSSYLALKGTDSVVSILLLVLIFAAYVFVGGPDYIPLIRGMEYVSTVLSLSTTGSMFVIIMKFMMGYVSNASIPLSMMSQMGASMVSLSFDKVLSPVMTLMSILSNYAGLVVGEFMTKLGLLCFIRSSMFAVFLPMGFFLRGFGLTKGAGNAILALAIAFFFFYPVTLTMNLAILNVDTALNSQTLGTAVWNSAASYVKFMAIPLTLSFASKAVPRGIGEDMMNFLRTKFPSVSGTVKVLNAGVNLFSVLSKGSTVLLLAYLSLISMIVFNAIFGVIYLLVKLVLVYGIILTAIDIFATLMFARELSGILGTPIELSAFMKIL